uniref:Coiled-coil domain containing 198 n=1 Tax=Ornithorhynchus anatinus TaxID=9258 RepID=F7EUX7_ORNAN
MLLPSAHTDLFGSSSWTSGASEGNFSLFKLEVPERGTPKAQNKRRNGGRWGRKSHLGSTFQAIRNAENFTVPGAMTLDTSLENRGTSIIKSHPPRRLQVLEPVGPPQARGSLTQHEAAVAPRAKELEKRMQSVRHPLGKRQYFHKMQMLEMNRKRQEAQAELKRNLQRESRIGKQKARERRGKKPSVNLPGNRGWEDLATPEPPGALPADWGSPWDGEFGACQPGPRQGGEAEPRLVRRAHRELPWETADSDSDGEAEERKKPRALVRTKTERIPLWDEFFDQE